MEFLFFDTNDARLFARSDAESANWTVEEMSLQALFPFDPDKHIQQGQRIAFVDELGVLQPFEIRKVRTYEPDHYQEITAEHIVISELSDEHLPKAEFTSLTASAALTQILTGTLWSVGTDTTSGGTSSGDVSMGSVWQGIRTIEQNWNVYVTPRVTFNAISITGRYLDIIPAEPVFRGLRLSLDKNADEMGVTWDDTNVITAIYGYGGRVANTSGDDTEALTFADVVWSTEDGDPVNKPAGQAYVENPTAKAIYGRNGRNRFGYYQNSDINDAETLLQKAWEVLLTSIAPEVSIDCQIRDLYKLGYADEPIRLHDEAFVDVRPTGEHLRLGIIRLTVNLLDPTATQVTIGSYIPNIIYIQRETKKAAGGGGGGGLRGGKQGAEDNRIYEFETQVQANQYQIGLRAWQRDLEHTDENLLLAYAAIGISSDRISSIVTGSGVVLNPDGSIQTDANGNPVFASGSSQMWSNVQQNKDRIALVVDGNGIKAAAITLAITQAGSSATISADNVLIDAGSVLLSGKLSAMDANFDNLVTGRTMATKIWANYCDIGNLNILPNGSIAVGSGELYVGQTAVYWKSYTARSCTLTSEHQFLDSAQNVVSGRLVTGYTDTTLHYLGY